MSDTRLEHVFLAPTCPQTNQGALWHRPKMLEATGRTAHSPQPQVACALWSGSHGWSPLEGYVCYHVHEGNRHTNFWWVPGIESSATRRSWWLARRQFRSGEKQDWVCQAGEIVFPPEPIRSRESELELLKKSYCVLCSLQAICGCISSTWYLRMISRDQMNSLIHRKAPSGFHLLSL
jgi:hypothetical protein